MKLKRQAFYNKFVEEISKYNKFIIVPHNEIDLDSLGSSLGLYTLLSSLGKETYINLDEQTPELGVKRALQKIKELDLNINSEKLENLEINNDSLLIILDFHKKDMAQNPDIFRLTNNVIIIDHHIESKDSIKSYLLKYIDDEASSTTEIIYDLLEMENISIPNYIATVMLAGITVDTNNFSIKTSPKTHEVAAMLSKKGAITKEVQYLLKEDLKEYVSMQKIIFNTEIINKVFAVTVGKKSEIYTKEQLAKIADSLLQFDEIEASFCIGKINSNIIGISARSLGNIDVQKIMEKLNGGGHLTDAACQMYNTTLDKAKSTLLKTINKLEK